MASFYGGGRSGTNVGIETEEKFNLHILNGESHTTNEERQKWNKKVSVDIDLNNHKLEFIAEE